MAKTYSFGAMCGHCGILFIATNPATKHCSRECAFYSKVSKTPTETGCLLWLAGVGNRGYGLFWNERAHRVAWRLAFGKIPDPRLMVLHACDTPLCCNPDHLMLGTGTANLIDCNRKMRHSHGERHHSAKLTEGQVREIRGAKEAGFSGPYLATLYGVSKSNINRAARGATWARVEAAPAWEPIELKQYPVCTTHRQVLIDGICDRCAPPLGGAT